MLNEFLEFKAYVTEPQSKTPRVQPNFFTDFFCDQNNLIGIEEIMTVIARGFIYSKDKYVYDEFDRVDEKTVDDAMELLHRWTGFSDYENRKRTDNSDLDKWMKKNSVVDGWLKIYWLFWFDAKKGKDKKLSEEEKNKEWNKLEKKWNKRFNSPMDYYAGRITYKNVIANALEKGPLRNRYLVVKKSTDQVGKKVKKSDDEKFKYLIDRFGQQITTDMKIMKIICAYLIFREFHPKGQKEVWIKSSELSRWYALDDGKKGSAKWYPECAIWNEKPIYVLNKVKGNHTKLIVDSEYLKTFDIRIVDSKDAYQYKDTHWVLEDLGHGLKECWNIK